MLVHFLAFFPAFSLIVATGCGSPPSRLARPKLPNLLSDSAPPEVPSSDAEFQIVVAKHLNRVVRAMAPVCGDRCGTVGAIPDPSLTGGAGTHRSIPGYASLIVYPPDDSLCVRASEELLFYCWAHEYGHHLDATMFGNVSTDPWVYELHADALAGCALVREGLSLEPLRIMVERWTRSVSPTANRWILACGADETHPHIRWTWKAVQKGAEVCARPGATVPLIVQAVESTIEEAHETAAQERKRLRKSLPCEGS